MKLIYTRENRYLVLNAQNLLQQAGIQVVLKNEFAAGAAGELAPMDTWLELWLVNEQDEQQALAVLKPLDQADGSDWSCPGCGESNGAAFDFCWQCGAPRVDG